MRPQELDFIETRKLPAILESGELPDFRSQDEKEFFQEHELVFDHQIAVFNQPNQDDILSRHIAWQFYNMYYRCPKIHVGFHGAEIPKDTFVRQITTPSGAPDRNNISFLTGDVGSGKTSFLNYLITSVFSSTLHEGNFWFMRIDFHRETKKAICDESVFSEVLIRKAADVISKNTDFILGNDDSLVSAFAECRDHIAKDKFGDARSSLISLVSLVARRRKIRLVIFMDNIDYLCHQNDRRLFDDDDDTREGVFLLDFVSFVASFFHGGKWARLGANILMVTRFDSLNILKSTNPTDGFRFDGPSYTLGEVPWYQVFECRKQLLEAHFKQEKKEAKREKFLAMLEKIEAEILEKSDDKNSLANHVRFLSRYGFRGAVEFFSQYAWIGGDEKGGRLIHQYPVGLMAFILGRKLIFRQMKSGFPNIYLVNKLQEDSFESETHHHRHSYWLKRLIAQLVEQDVPYNIPEFYYLFGGLEEGDGYENGLVRTCIGSLYESNVSDMLHANRVRDAVDPNKIKVDSISLSARGKHCLEIDPRTGISRVFDRFFYLQLIVDEPNMPLPVSILDHFDYTMDYSYILNKDSDAYWSGAKAMIKKKALQVLLFLIVLEISLDLERELYSSAFARLEKKGVVVPKVSKIRARIVSELRAVSRKHGRFIDVKAVIKQAKEMEEDIRGDLENVYTLP